MRGKLYIESFGCQMNTADSEEMRDHFAERGILLTSDPNAADVYLVNTCTVRQHAEQKALSLFGRLREWKALKSGRSLIVSGCAAERLKGNLKHRFPHIDWVIGAKSIDEFPALLDAFLHSRRGAAAFDYSSESEFSFSHAVDSRHAETLPPQTEIGYVTIMRGCNYSCSYCIVPSVRGREKYRPLSSIVEEAEIKVKAGAKEIMLLGQTVNSYWAKDPATDTRSDFSTLIEKIARIDGDFQIKFMSPHPHYMTEKLIQTLAQTPKIHPQIHLPVQSGSNRVLEMMRRNYTAEEYRKIVQSLEKALPNLQLSTDFIVGFPTETDSDFDQTYRLMEELPFQQAFCFIYSPRAGTESSLLKDDVPEPVKEERLQKLLQLLDKKRELSVLRISG